MVPVLFGPADGIDGHFGIACAAWARSARNSIAWLLGDDLPGGGCWDWLHGTGNQWGVAMRQLVLQVDGMPGIPARGTAGLGLVVRNPGGHVLTWRCQQVAALTNNEAEYHAVIAGLALIGREFPGAGVLCLTDSQIVVEQIAGRSAVRAESLRPLHTRLAAAAKQLPQVQFRLIPRELNRLADALAWEALSGRGALQRVISLQKEQRV